MEATQIRTPLYTLTVDNYELDVLAKALLHFNYLYKNSQNPQYAEEAKIALELRRIVRDVEDNPEYGF